MVPCTILSNFRHVPYSKYSLATVVRSGFESVHAHTALCRHSTRPNTRRIKFFLPKHPAYQLKLRKNW